MQRVITAHEATVRTATVEIKTLSISGKQVTLSVFRQIPYKDIIGHWADTKMPAMLGLPWGKVNYFWTGCMPQEMDYLHQIIWKKHGAIHVLWQNDDVLYRSVVVPKDSYDSPFKKGYNVPDEERGLAEQWGQDYKELYNELWYLQQIFIAV